MSLATWHWHIEISSKCTLQCPRCARSEVPDSLVNTELDLEFFKKNFTPSFIATKLEKITFCGDDGDPIYAHDLIPVIRYIKSIRNVAIVIVTNGSYKKEDWWIELGHALEENDQVHFSLDGWDQESNEKYRINSDWESIMLGVKTLRNHSKCFINWATIAFQFNEDKLDDMKSMAKELGFDHFQLTKSTKFGSKYDSYDKDDLLEPIKKDLISSTHRFQREITNLSGRILEEKYLKTNNSLFENVQVINENIKPICHIGNKGLYINSKGEFFPCCWVANRYNHNSEWINLAKRYNLHDVTLEEVVGYSFWENDFSKNSIECITKCNTDVVDKNYATEW